MLVGSLTESGAGSSGESRTGGPPRIGRRVGRCSIRERTQAGGPPGQSNVLVSRTLGAGLACPCAASKRNEPIFPHFSERIGNKARAAAALFVLIVPICATPVAGSPQRPPLRRFDTPYYFIHTDLQPALAAEAEVRLTRLGEVLRRRTRELGFTGRIRQRVPVYLFRHREDYLATGAPPESAGAFLGDRLVVAATDRGGWPAWHVVQHEAFHQFAAAAQGPQLPGWLNEGLGEYFGEALFTGDGYVSGVVPDWRRERVRKAISGGAFAPVQRFLQMSQEQWSRKVVVVNYDQAWSLVHFILHREGGAGDKDVSAFVKSLAAGQAPGRAWDDSFGDVDDFERRWREYWSGRSVEAAADRYAEAAAATVTSFVARAAAEGQSFERFAEFLDAAKGGRLRCGAADWLPASLLHRALNWAPPGAEWSLETREGTDRVLLTTRAGARFIGTFVLQEGRVREVLVRREGSVNR